MLPTPTPINFINPTNFPAARFADIGTIMNILNPVIMLIAAFIFGAMFISAGFTYLTAGGDPEKVSKAQSTATWASMGILIIFVAYLIVRLVSFIIGITVVPF
ncbi:MAG: hypothetical protein O3B87_01795 [bacterium]|nr:hypothetical protein [bacterium]